MAAGAGEPGGDETNLKCRGSCSGRCLSCPSSGAQDANTPLLTAIHYLFRCSSASSSSSSVSSSLSPSLCAARVSGCRVVLGIGFGEERRAATGEPTLSTSAEGAIEGERTRGEGGEERQEGQRRTQTTNHLGLPAIEHKMHCTRTRVQTQTPELPGKRRRSGHACSGGRPSDLPDEAWLAPW